MWNMDRGINPFINPFKNSSKKNNLENYDPIKANKANLQNQNYLLNRSSIRFGFNFYFNNIKSSLFSPINSPKEQYFNKINNSSNQNNIPISLLFKSSLEKSGFKIPNEQAFINNNEYFNEHNNINNYYDDTRLFNIPININYPINNNNIINNIYPTINKVSNVKIVSKNNTKLTENKANGKIFANKKENINYNILNNIIQNDKKVDYKIKEKNIILENKEIKDNSMSNKTKVFFECSEIDNNNEQNISTNFLKKKRSRKNDEQICILSKFYNEHKNWTRNEIKEISQNTGLKEKKIYKWLWDKKNKDFNNKTKFIINKNNN